MPMAGPWGSSSADSQQSGPATTKVVGGALTSASARGCPLRAAADETARQHRGQRQAQGSFCGHARSCRTQDRSRQAPGGARGSTESLVPAGETREASISPDLWHVFRVLCDSPSSGHQAQRHRSRRHARVAENVWQPCRASGCRSDPCLAPRSRALRCICILVAAAPPAVHLTAPPRDAQERSLPIPGVCRHRTCVFWLFPADLDDFGVVTPYPGLAALFATVWYYSYVYRRYVWLWPVVHKNGCVY
jgi:hypothetical protein